MIAAGRCPGRLFQISRRAIALIVSIWLLKQTFEGCSSSVIIGTIKKNGRISYEIRAIVVVWRVYRLVAKKPTEHKGHHALPCLRVWRRACNLLHNVEPFKVASIVYCQHKAGDELGRGDHLTLPELEYDTSRPST